MTETQTPLQRFEEQTRKTFQKTKESVKNLLDKMRSANLGLEETEKEAEAPKEDDL